MVRNTEGEGLPHYYQFLTAVHRLPKPPSEKMEHRTIVTSHRCSILCSLFSLDYGEVVRNTDGGGATPLLPYFSQLLLLLTVYQKAQYKEENVTGAPMFPLTNWTIEKL